MPSHLFQMAYSSHLIALCSLLFTSLSVLTFAQTQLKPNAFLFHVTKDPSTLQYVTHIQERTPPLTFKVTVSLGAKVLWTDCRRYVSSTYQYYKPNTTQCIQAQGRLDGKSYCPNHTPVNGCHLGSCYDQILDPYGGSISDGELTSDVISIPSIDGKRPALTVPNFLFLCTRLKLLDSLAIRAKGIAGFGRSQVSIPAQFAKQFNYPNIFAMCLSGTSRGVIFHGEGPYSFLPNVVLSLSYTPLIANKAKMPSGYAHKESSSYYFIGVTKIKVNGKVVPVNTTLLSIDKSGNGGTKIGTAIPYSSLQGPVYDAVIKAFGEAMSHVTKVAPVEPFELCYDSKKIGNTRYGPAVPVIDLVLQSEEVVWKIYGANSMVHVSKDIMCLGFVKEPDYNSDGLLHAVVIGGHQLENNLLQFDLVKSRLGFSSTLLAHKTTCANFNYKYTV